MKTISIKEKLIYSLIVVLGLLGLSFLYFFLNRIYGFAIPCLFHKITGYYCPGCGITRTIFSLLQFDFIQAFHYNALVMLLLPIFAVTYSIQYYSWLTGKKVFRIPNWFWYLLLGITILFGILRNMDYFSFLQPTIIK